jgi:hypothetical protein
VLYVWFPCFDIIMHDFAKSWVRYEFYHIVLGSMYGGVIEFINFYTC